MKASLVLHTGRLNARVMETAGKGEMLMGIYKVLPRAPQPNSNTDNLCDILLVCRES